VSPVAEIPTYREPAKVITAAAVNALAKSIAAAEEAGEPALKALADEVVRERIQDWAQRSTAEIQSVCDAAVAKAIKGWQKKRGDLDHQVARAVANARTQCEMDQWAAAVIAQVMAEANARNLITTDVLEGITFTRQPPSKQAGPAEPAEAEAETTGKKPKAKPKSGPTDAYACTDDEFLAWFVAQLGGENGGGINNSNRLRFRLLLVAALDWLREESERWRKPEMSTL